MQSDAGRNRVVVLCKDCLKSTRLLIFHTEIQRSAPEDDEKTKSLSRKEKQTIYIYESCVVFSLK
jgi:hypothetical protein